MMNALKSDLSTKAISNKHVGCSTIFVIMWDVVLLPVSLPAYLGIFCKGHTISQNPQECSSSFV